MDKKIYNFKTTFHKINNLYNFYAKTIGINLAAILLLEILSNADVPYSQKELCEQLGQPKQLINSIIKSFWEQGYVELKEAQDRRFKKVVLTDEGRRYAVSVIKPLQEAERAAWGCFSVEEIVDFSTTMGKYEKSLSQHIQ